MLASVGKLSTLHPIKCGPSEYAVYDPQHQEKIVKCELCPRCPRGEGVPVQCGSRVSDGTSTQCKSCEHGKTFSNTTDSSMCLHCHECGKKTVLHQCNLTDNRKCGDCPAKHFLDPHLNDCVECFTCCSDVPDNERIEQCGKVLGLPKSEWCEPNEKNKLCAKLNTAKNNKANETISTTSLRVVNKTLSSTGSFGESRGNNDSTISRNRTALVSTVEKSGDSSVQIGIATSFSLFTLLAIVGFIIYKKRSATQASSSNRNGQYVGVETGIDNSIIIIVPLSYISTCTVIQVNFAGRILLYGPTTLVSFPYPVHLINLRDMINVSLTLFSQSILKVTDPRFCLLTYELHTWGTSQREKTWSVTGSTFLQVVGGR